MVLPVWRVLTVVRTQKVAMMVATAMASVCANEDGAVLNVDSVRIRSRGWIAESVSAVGMELIATGVSPGIQVHHAIVATLDGSKKPINLAYFAIVAKADVMDHTVKCAKIATNMTP